MKDKITAHSFDQIIIPNPDKNKPSKKAIECYELHLQSLQQILEEAGEELPDTPQWEKWFRENRMNSLGTFEWMRSEASKVVAKWKEKAENWKWAQIKWRGEVEQRDKEMDELVKRAASEMDKAQDQIQQLKEELARKDADAISLSKWIMDHVRRIALNEDWYSEGYRYFIQVSRAESVRVKTMEDIMKHYQASKTDKP